MTFYSYERFWLKNTQKRRYEISTPYIKSSRVDIKEAKKASSLLMNGFDLQS